MFCISRRKRAGMSSIASATSCSNLFRFTGLLHHVLVIVTVVPDGALIAQRLRLADASAVKDLHVRRERPQLLWQTAAELLFHVDGVVAFRDPDAIGHTQDVAIDRQAGHAERMPEYDVGGLAPDAGASSASPCRPARRRHARRRASAPCR